MTQYTDDDIRNSVTDEYGNTIGSVEKVTAGSIGAGGLVAFLVVVAIVFVSFDNFTEQLSNAFMIGKSEFITITVSNVILIIINILSICFKKITIISYQKGFLATLMSELITGVVIYIALWVIMVIYGIATGEGVLNMLAAAPLAMLMYSLSFLVVMVSVALVFSIILFSMNRMSE